MENRKYKNSKKKSIKNVSRMTEVTTNISVITINVNAQITSKNLYDLPKK